MALPQPSDCSTFCWVVVFLVCFLDGADTAMIGATMKSLEESLGLTPFTLGMMAFAQASTMAVAAPLWGWMDDTGAVSRRRLMAGATFGWGLMMILTSVSVHPAMLVVARLLNGVFVASLIPLTQTFVCDHVAPERRGKFFGYLGGVTALGSTVTSSITIYVASASFRGIVGWRIVSFAVGILSIFMCFFIRAFMEDGREARGRSNGLVEMFGEVCANLRRHWRVPTFRIIIGQGCFGSIPWRALEFESMFLLYVGFTPSQVSAYVLAVAPIKILGVTIGGYVGDWAASISPWHGRPWTAMLSVAAGIPCTVVVLRVLPDQVGPELGWYIVMCYIFHATASWCLAGVNRPILNDIVDPKCRASIVAWDHAIEGLVSAICGMPLLGYIADSAFGYIPTKLAVTDMPATMRIHNLQALRMAMLVMQVTPWAICFCFFSGLHWTYKADMQKISKTERSERLSTALTKLSEKTPLVLDAEYNEAGAASFKEK